MAVNLSGMLTSLNQQLAPRQEAPQVPLGQQDLMQRSGVTNPLLQRAGQMLGGVFGVETRSPQQMSSEEAASMYDVSTPQYKYELARRVMPFDPQQGRALLLLAQQQEEAEKNRASLEKRAAASAEKEGRLLSPDKQAIREATDLAGKAEDQLYVMQDLARRYEEVQPTGGYLGSAAGAFREFVGRTNDIDLLKTEYLALRNEFVGQNLPPGAASDADVRLALEGFPTTEYSAKDIASFLRGQAKIAAIKTEKNRLRAKYLSDNKGDDSGFSDAWTQLRNSEGFSEQLAAKYNFTWNPIEEPVDFNTAKIPTQNVPNQTSTAVPTAPPATPTGQTRTPPPILGIF